MNMEATSALSFSSPKPRLLLNLCNSSSSPPPCRRRPVFPFPLNHRPKFPKSLTLSSSSTNSLSLSPPNAVAEAVEAPAAASTLPNGSYVKIDRSGRFCSPRAARELALLIAYAACLEGSDPVFLFDKRVNVKKVPGYVFNRASLLQYDHMSFGGEPVRVETEKEAEELMQKNESDSLIEAEVLSAPPKLVYNKFVLRLARGMLEAVVNQWNQHVLVIDKIIPPNWKAIRRTLDDQRLIIWLHPAQRAFKSRSPPRVLFHFLQQTLLTAGEFRDEGLSELAEEDAMPCIPVLAFLFR